MNLGVRCGRTTHRRRRGGRCGLRAAECGQGRRRRLGVALVPLSRPLPSPLDEMQSRALSGAAAGVQQMRADAPAQIDQVRAGVAPLAAGNTVADEGIGVAASLLEATAAAGGPAVAPADTTVRETATIVRANQKGSGC